MILLRLRVWLSDMTDDVWKAPLLEQHTRECCKLEGIEFKQAAMLLRASITGRLVSPPIFWVAEILGRKETLDRIDNTLKTFDPEGYERIHNTDWIETPPAPDKVKKLLEYLGLSNAIAGR